LALQDKNGIGRLFVLHYDPVKWDNLKYRSVVTIC